MRVRTPHPAVAEVGQLLGEFLGSYELARSGVSPTPDSPWRAEEDMGLPPTCRPGMSGSILTHATLSTHLRMLASMDCMTGIVSSIEAGTSLYSVFPLARTAVEGFAYAAWILDPRITGEQRAAVSKTIEGAPSTSSAPSGLRRQSVPRAMSKRKLWTRASAASKRPCSTSRPT